MPAAHRKVTQIAIIITSVFYLYNDFTVAMDDLGFKQCTSFTLLSILAATELAMFLSVPKVIERSFIGNFFTQTAVEA